MARSRPKPNPRPLRVRNQFQPPLGLLTFLGWTAGANAILQLQISLGFVPDGVLFSVTNPDCKNGFRLVGIALDIQPIAVSTPFDNDILHLTFGQDIPLVEGFLFVQPYINGLRSRQAGYLAPGKYDIPGAP